MQTPGVGPATARLLLDAFGSPAALFAAERRHLHTLVGSALAAALLAPGAALLRQVDAALAWAAAPGRRLLTLHDPGYPLVLAHGAEPPPLLYVSGRAELLLGPCLGMVGSRNASLQGQANAELFAEALSVAGLTIVSGLALGIDTAAHLGALRGASATVAVIGTGPDLVYPARNRALWQRIAEEGCVVSEYAPGTPPLAHNFPQRNRIISGLSAGVLVVEAAARSGSLITARLAAAQGREVFAIPGSIHSALARGCHLLLKEGARLVESAADVLLELRDSPIARMGVQQAHGLALPRPAANASAPPAAPGNGEAALLDAALARLLDLLDAGPLGVEALAAGCGGAPHQLAAPLLELELAGHLERLADGRYQRVRGRLP